MPKLLSAPACRQLELITHVPRHPLSPRFYHISLAIERMKLTLVANNYIWLSIGITRHSVPPRIATTVTTV